MNEEERGKAEQAGDLSELAEPAAAAAEADDRDRKLAEAEEARRLAEEERDRAVAAMKAEEARRLRAEQEQIREAALRRYLSEKGLDGDAGEAALLCLRGMGTEGQLSAEGGVLTEESREALDGLFEGGSQEGGSLRALLRLRRRDGEDDAGTEGVPVANPPLGMGIGAPSREEILAIRDGAERRRAIAEHPEVFGL